MFLFNYFKRREKGTERTIRITLSLISLAEELCVFSGTGAARPSIFTMFDITRVFIKVTLIKSRPRSLGRNNNFFPRLAYRIDATREIEEKYYERKLEARIPSTRPFDFARNDRRSGNQCHFVYQEALYHDSHWPFFPCVARID